jgi:hypothetical protein
MFLGVAGNRLFFASEASTRLPAKAIIMVHSFLHVIAFGAVSPDPGQPKRWNPAAECRIEVQLYDFFQCNFTSVSIEDRPVVTHSSHKATAWLHGLR